MKKVILVFVFLVLLCAIYLYYQNVQKSYEENEMREPDELISREVLFGNPDRVGVRLSYDGKYLSYIAPKDGVLNVWVAPRDKLDEAKPVTGDKSRGIRSYHWSYDNKHIIYAQDKKGDENWQLHLSDVETAKTKPLTPGKGERAGLLKLSPEHPEEALITMNERDKQFFDVHRLNLVTGEMEMVFKNTEGFVSFTADHNLSIRSTYKIDPDGQGKIFVMEKNMDVSTLEPVLFKTVKNEDIQLTHVSHVTRDGNYLYMVDGEGRNTSGLFRVHLDSKKAELISEDAKVDVGYFMHNPKTKVVEAVAYSHFKKKWKVLDKEISKDLDYLAKVEEGEIDVTSRTYEDDFWIVVYQKDDGANKYYLYNRVAKKAEFLFSSQSDFDGQPFTKMYPELIFARDGLEIVSYLSVPRWLDDGSGRVKEPIPMVLYVHGGPDVRDHFGFHPVHQWLANRGYAVLSVNYRGSSGLGKKHLNKGDGQWYGAMQDDLEDAVYWAFDQGITKPGKVAIMGGSYGGYATLAGLTKTPELYAAGVDIVGPSNLITLLESIPPYWKPLMAHLAKKVGATPDTEEGREFLKSRSPLTYADKIKKPLLIVQGANDPRVTKAESDQIVGKMKELNIPVSYLLYPDEGHGLARPENRFSYYANAEQFLAKFLGGRFEESDGKFEGSSVQYIEMGH